jgi:hypothetical protein
MPTTKRQATDWYTPYFAPTTILVAALVLLVSIQAGWFAGNYFIERDKASASLTAPVNPTVQHAAKAPRHTPAARSGARASKTSHS